MQLHLAIDLRAVLIGVVLLFVAAGIATPFAVSLANDENDVPGAQAATSLGTAFTYQGQLNDVSGPANGSFDFQFRLFDDINGSIPTVLTVVSRTANVTDGLFTAELDFGAAPFDGSARFIEVRVKATGAPGAFELMDPLQPLTVVPQAIFAMKAGSVEWSNIANKPLGFADDVDNDTTYTPGPGLVLSGTEFSVQFLGPGAVNGSATSAARSDHTHFGQTWTGNADFGLNVTSQSLSGAAIAVYGYAVDGYGVRGGATSGIGLRGDSTSNYGIYAQSVSGTALGAVTTGGIGVYAQNSSSNTPALVARNLGTGDLIHGLSMNGTQVFKVSRSGGVDAGTLFLNNDNGVAGYSIYLTNNSDPTFAVRNDGNVYADGSFNGGGFDIAEHVTTTGAEPGPGDVVEVDPAHQDRFRLAASGNSTLVAGVISTNPGVVLGSGMDDFATTPRLALAGRVPVKVSAENGPIQLGDLLVSSSTPGHAMKAPTDPAAGTVVGKALGSLDAGTGTVTMLVMLR